MNRWYEMPVFAARFFMVSRRSFDNRILIRSVFGLNSKRTGIIPDRSYSVRSAVATKCSAALLLESLGSLFFIMLNDFGNRHAVLAALVTIAVVPVEACHPKLRGLKMSIVHTIVN